MEPAGKTQKIPKDFQFRSDNRPLVCCLASSSFAYGETNIGFARDNNEDSFGFHGRIMIARQRYRDFLACHTAHHPVKTRLLIRR